MKKIIIPALLLMAMAVASCQKSVKANLQDNVDSLAYELGIAQGFGLKNYMQMQLRVDTTYMDEFIRGMKQGALNEPDPKQHAYMQGVEIGQQVLQMSESLTSDVYPNDSTASISVDNLLAGIITALKGEAGESGDEAYEKFQALMEPIQLANLLAEFGDNKAAGEAYLAENAKKEGVVVLPSGVQYLVLEEGHGDVPADTAKVDVSYEGKLVDGTVFDSNLEEGRKPLTINMANMRVVPGFGEVVKMMPVGAKWEVVIPQDQAYGQRRSGKIMPFSTLIFTIERLN